MSQSSKKSRAIIKASQQRYGNDAGTAFWLAATLFFFYLLTTSAHRPYGDEAKYLAVAESILTHGTPAIVKAQKGADGQLQNGVSTSKFSLGQSLLLLPLIAIAVALKGLFGSEVFLAAHFLINALPAAESAGICALLFLIIRLLGDTRMDLQLSPRAAIALVLATGIGTQIWPASRILFADNSVAFLLMLATYCLLRFRYADSGIGWAISATWAAAAMVLCKNLLFLACPGLIVYGFWAGMERKREGRWISARKTTHLLLMTAIPFIVIIAAQLWYNHFRYGSIWLSGYHEGRDGDFGFSTPLLVGLYGILFSSGRSFFLYSPPCLLALLGARNFLRSAPAESALIAGTALPVLFAYAKWWAWHGGWEWGNRFFLFLIPFLMWFSTPAWRWINQKLLPPAIRWLYQISFALLIAGSIYVQGLGVLIHPAAYWALNARELTILEYPVYRERVWEIRDDMPLVHFVPEFSPFAAHHWLIWATWNRSRLDDRALAANAPWTSLNPKWAPGNVRPYLGFDLWFYGEWVRNAALTGFAILVAGSLVILMSFCIIRLSMCYSAMMKAMEKVS